MTNRSLLDYLGEHFEPAQEPRDEMYPVDQLRARLAELESKLTAAANVAPVPAVPVAPPEPPLSTQIESILKRRDGLSPDRIEPRQEQLREAVRGIERHHERMAMQAPPLAPEAAAASGDFGRFVDAVQLIAQAASRYLQQSQGEPVAVRREIAPPAAAPEISALSESLKQVLGALHDMTDEFRSATEEMRRGSNEARKSPEDRHAAPRRISRDDAELFRLQDDLDDLRERLGSLTRHRSRNSY
jgi:hypothetical protein